MRRSISIVVLLVGILVAANFTAMVRPLNLHNSNPQKMQVDKKVWDGSKWVDEITANVGDNVRFRISVYQPTYDPLEHYVLYDILIKDTLPAGMEYVPGSSSFYGNAYMRYTTAEPQVNGNILIWDLDTNDCTVEIGENESFYIEFKAKIVGYGDLINEVNVSAWHCSGENVYGDAQAKVRVSPPQPSMTLKKLVSLDGRNWTKSVREYLPKVEKVYFKIILKNTGDVDITGILEDFLPPFLRYNYDSNITPNFANDTYMNWTINLPACNYIEITFSATPLSGGEGKNIANVKTDQGINARDDVTVILYEPSIDINKKVRKFCSQEDWGENVEVSGGIVEFRVDITYHGNPLDPLDYVFHNIVIVDQLPSILEYVENSTKFKGDWSNWNEYYSGDIEPTVSDHNLIWDLDDIFRIPDGGTLTLYFKARVTDNPDCGTFENVVIVNGDECSGTHLEGRDNATIKIPCPEIDIEKKIRDPGTGEWKESAYVFYGDKIIFNITIYNTGGMDISGVEVRDPLLNESSYRLEYVSANPEPSSIKDNTLIWHNIMIKAGKKFYIELTVRFTGENCYGCYNNTAYLTYYVGCKKVEKNDSASFCIRNDGYPPRSRVNPISPYWHNGSFVIRAAARDNETYVARVDLYYSSSSDGVNWSGWSRFGSDTNGADGWSWVFFGRDGYYKFCSIAYDAVGNKENKVYLEEASAGIDTVAPQSRVNPISPYKWNITPITLSYTASDDRSGVGEVVLYYRYSADNRSWTTWREGDWSFSPTSNGYYEFYSIAIDNAGNVEPAPSQADARCMLELPGLLQASIEAPDYGLVGHDITFTGRASGGYPPYTFDWKFGDGGVGHGTSVVHRYSSQGTYEVNLTVTDSRGNRDWATHTIEIYPLKELKVNITKPEAGAVYFRDRKIISLPVNLTIVIGKITISAEVEDAYGDVAVEFKINSVSKALIETEPFNYTWNERAFFRKHIEVIAYDDFDGTRTANATRDILIFNLGLNRTKSNETGTIEGKVYEASKPIRKPGIPGVKVTVLETDENVTTGKFLWMKGRFTIRLSSGKYTLRFEKQGYETKEVEVNVTSGRITRICVPLNRTEPGYIKGKVYENGTILKKGIGGVSITVIETNTTVTTSRLLEGRYSIELNPGVYHLRFEKKGYATKVVEVRVNASEVTRINVGLDRLGTLYGRVLEAKKLFFRGIRGAIVEAVNNETGERFSVNTSFRGKYSIDLPAGEYTVTASAEGYSCVTEYVTIKAGKSTRQDFKLPKL